MTTTMAQNLPDDVWSQIAETWLDQKALQNVSLTSRWMHDRLVVPVLFHQLEFHVTHAGSEYFMARLIRNIMRARFLSNSPELLRHTRFFVFWENFHTLDWIAKYLALHQGSDSSSSRSDAEHLLAVLRDVIYRLIFRMPGIRDIQIGNTVMTPLCYSAILSRPLLTSLRLEPRRSPDITYVPPALPHALRLRDFSCYYDNRTGNERPTDPYVTDILDHCILKLEKLSISSNLLPLVISRIPLHHTLSLRSLSVRFPFFLPDGLEAAALLQILCACPQLRNLDFRGDFPDIDPTHYLPFSLPNLSTFSGPPRLLQILYEGTNLVEIDIHDHGYIQVQSLTQIIRIPPTDLRELSMGFVEFSHPHELLTFIRSLAVLQNLETLYIAYGHGMAWKDHVSAQDSHNTIKDLLHQLACLRFLNIFTSSGNTDGYDVGCPISKQGEPADRGHSSLENIHVDFLCGWWSWNSGTGWKESNVLGL